MKPISRLLLAAAAVVLPAPAIAHGEIAAVIVYGPAKPQQREVVLTTAQQTLRAASWTVQDQPWSAREHETVVACISLDRPWPCVAATARNKGVDHVVVIHIATDKADQGLVLTGQILVAGDTVPSTDRGWCPKCSDVALATSTSELAALLLKHSQARRQGQSQPAASPVTATPPAAAPHPPAAPTAAAEPQPASSPSRVVPALVIGAGVVAIGVGSYLAYQANAPAEGPQSQYVYSGPGLGLAIAGSAAVGIGLYLWLRNAHRDSAPMLSPASGGAVAGWITTL